MTLSTCLGLFFPIKQIWDKWKTSAWWVKILTAEAPQLFPHHCSIFVILLSNKKSFYNFQKYNVVEYFYSNFKNLPIPCLKGPACTIIAASSQHSVPPVDTCYITWLTTTTTLVASQVMFGSFYPNVTLSVSWLALDQWLCACLTGPF